MDTGRKNIRDPQTYAIIGAAMEVHGVLGCGFLEAVYQEALEVEFASRSIPFIREPTINVTYKGHVLEAWYRPDFVCYDEIVVELKALEALCGAHQSVVINYLKATRYHRALLLNFGAERLQFERLVLGESPTASGN